MMQITNTIEENTVIIPLLFRPVTLSLSKGQTGERIGLITSSLCFDPSERMFIRAGKLSLPAGR